MRGRVLLNISASAAGGARQQRVLPLAWDSSARQAIHAAVLAIHADFKAGVPLDLAIETHAQISSEESSSHGVTVNEAINWPQLIQAFKDHKLSSGSIKQSTWDGIYWRRMAVILEAVGGKRRPVSSKQLLESVIESWKDRPGSRGRQLQVQFTAALLRWGVDSERLPSSWAPPLDLSIYGRLGSGMAAGDSISTGPYAADATRSWSRRPWDLYASAATLETLAQGV